VSSVFDWLRPLGLLAVQGAARAKRAGVPLELHLVGGAMGEPGDLATERAVTRDEEIALTWYNIGEPLLIHTQPNAEPGRPYGVCTVLIPALGARLTRNGVQAVGQPWKREREGRPFSTCALAFSESWTASP